MGHKRRIRAGKAIAFLLLGIVTAVGLLRLGMWRQHRHGGWSPGYGQVDILPILHKSVLTQEDYRLLLRQTGLTRAGVDSLLEGGQKDRILQIQQAFFHSGKWQADEFAPFTCCHRTDTPLVTVPLEPGDIIYAPGTHFSFFELGHAAIVTDGQGGLALNAVGYGSGCSVLRVEDLTCRPCIIILRAKKSRIFRKTVAQYAQQDLQDLPYSVTVGLTREKFSESVQVTNCSHAIWYAYKKFGLDIDGNGGLFVLPRDFLQSEELEILQIYGADPTQYEIPGAAQLWAGDGVISS